MAERRGKEKRGRRRAGGLRKSQTVENVVVEEAFGLFKSKEKSGEGVYISATTSNNRRYYGVLLDQPALKEASSMWFQDQADSLELNRRMKVLMQKQQQEQQNQKQAAQNDNDEAKQSAEPKLDNSTSSNNTQEVAAPALDDRLAARAVASLPSMDNAPTESTPNAGAGKNAAAISQTAKRSLEVMETDESQYKRPRQEYAIAPETVVSRTTADPSLAAANAQSSTVEEERPVQKFKYVSETKAITPGRRSSETAEDPGYRILVATFCSVEESAGGNPVKTKAIQAACEEGGNFLPGDDTYYYQYEVLPTALAAQESQKSRFEMRTSMGFHSFLLNTTLPAWFPLSNLQLGSHKVLSMLNMKRDNSGNITWDKKPAETVSSTDAVAATLAGGTKLSMQTRDKHQYQIGIIGGGIAGLTCCQELVTLLQKEGIDAKVTLLEARSRLGGRLWTDPTFSSDGKPSVPIELGASWIHGIDDNPLAALAKRANIDFATASEEVQMLGKDLKRMNSRIDEGMGTLFDDLLDHAADDCWSAPEAGSDMAKIDGQDPQAAIRWYSSVFVEDKPSDDSTPADGGEAPTKDACGASAVLKQPELVGIPTHRRSSDRSIDFEIGKAIAEHKFREVSKLTVDEHRMLLWNTKNVEYALGANITDLSMKYWDSDERHAFEGDHVLLKQGYSSVIDYMWGLLKEAGGDKFETALNFPVGKIEYARKSASEAYGRDRLGRARKLVELSDTCSVTSQDGSHTKYFDFVVCAVPLGVLKESVQRAEEADAPANFSFQPPLPFSKVDAISSVGFGLLNKVYLQFPTAFWRLPDLFKGDDQCLFGNVSGLNPHHYMFFDVGRCLGSGEGAPPILMSLISGKEAVACERMSDKELANEVVATLKAIFTASTVPEPTAFRFTRWGQDKFCRGSYTFLPPGATDQDFHLLQSPINGNGDSLLLEASETMRLFFAGEHTTALHPSMAHGAMLSGMRAAKEIVSALQFRSGNEKDIDRVIPVALFRHKFPTTELRCSLCHKIGGQVREGSLVAFKRGARQVLVHNNCAEYSPEVEVIDFKWRNVVKAVNRSKSLNCTLCKQSGATIGCAAENCFRVFHFSCSEDSGWRFDRDGKGFFCDLHRKTSPTTRSQCDRVSLKFYLTKSPDSSLFCSFCHSPEETEHTGKFLAFQSGARQTCVHESCIKCTTIVDTGDIEESRMGNEYRNIFHALDKSGVCIKCANKGATVGCTDSSCDQTFHLPCAKKSGWSFDKRGKLFRCEIHRQKTEVSTLGVKAKVPATEQSNGNPGLFQHNLLAKFGAVPVLGGLPREDKPSNLNMGGTAAPAGPPVNAIEEIEAISDSDESFPGLNGMGIEVVDVQLFSDVAGSKQLVRIERASRAEMWKISLKVVQNDGANVSVLAVAATTSNESDLFSLQVGDIIISMNGKKVGTGELQSLHGVLSRLKEEVDLMMEIVRK